jgi:hypothetical protein
MITSQEALKKYGAPEKESSMVVWDIPADINGSIPTLPNRLYCNKDMIQPLEKAFRAIIAAKLQGEVKTFDGCFNIRSKRGQSTQSLHSWGIAIDINAAWNGFGAKPTMSNALVQCFTYNGFDWGGTWSKPDGMHFQLKSI